MPKIIDIEGIGPYYAKKLNSIGIKTTDSLLKHGLTPGGKENISKKTGIPYKLIQEWVNIADLVRIKGIGEEYSDLIEEAGVKSAAELAGRDPDILFKQLIEVNENKRLVRKPPPLQAVKDWIEQARIISSPKGKTVSSISTTKATQKRPLSITFAVIWGALFLIIFLISFFASSKDSPLTAISIPFLIFGFLSIIVSAILLLLNLKNSRRRKGFKYVLSASGIVTFIAVILITVSAIINPSPEFKPSVAEEAATNEAENLETVNKNNQAENKAEDKSPKEELKKTNAAIKDDTDSQESVEQLSFEIIETETAENGKEAGETEAPKTESPPEEETMANLEIADAPPGALKVHFIDVGQGDSALIQTPEGNTILIDGGPISSGPGLVSYLKNNNISKINIMVATHPHADHIGGLINVLNNFEVDNIIDSGVSHTTNTYMNYLRTLQSKDINFVNWDVGQSFDVGNDITMKIIGPTSKSSDLNNCSIVILLSYKDSRFLFTGDAESGEEAKILKAGYEVNADVLKVGHHGSSTSCCDNFLNAVKPSVAIISCGAANSYGHPHDTILAALAGIGAEIYRTDSSGTIVIESDGNSEKVSKGKQYTFVAEADEGKPETDQTQSNEIVAVIPVVPDEPPPETTTEQVPEAGIQVTTLSSPVAQGANASISIKTAPGATCHITVYYKSGPSEAAGLEPKTSDQNGNCSWTWKVGTRTTPGDWKIVISVDGVGQTECYFTVIG